MDSSKGRPQKREFTGITLYEEEQDNSTEPRWVLLYFLGGLLLQACKL